LIIKREIDTDLGIGAISYWSAPTNSLPDFSIL